ncbi:MAG: hypothetical protein ACK2UU_17775 [Anaerolineae bacterium]|jgi:hypothetical protein
MTDDDRFQYNLRAIRELLVLSYNAVDLHALIAYDEELRPLRYEFADSDSILVLAGKTIEYCMRRVLMDHLLSLVAEDRPAQYARFEDSLRVDREGEG